MLVYVINKHGKPLMPCKPRKARVLLEAGKAKVVQLEPFTIQLLFGSTGYKQEISLGVDAGSKIIGLSATTEQKELFASEIELRNDISENLATRREARRTRRNRKTRYREARFNNRVKSKKQGWLAPSVKNKIETHLKVVANAHKILPISKIIVECASFDIQKIKNPEISGKEYQEGEQLDFWNVREYVLFRDNHICQCCKGKKKDKILNVHHIESRKIGGNAPNNLITLCETCHKLYHEGKIKLAEKIKRGAKFADASFMGIMRWAFYNQLKKIYNDVSMTFGYITKYIRIKYNLTKSHFVDARCISKNPLAKPLGYYFYQKKVRCHNRQIHKFNILQGGKRKNNQTDYLIKGFRLFDKVKYKFNNQTYFIFGRMKTGFLSLRNLLGEKANKNKSVISCKEVDFVSTTKSYLLTEFRYAMQP